MYIEKCKIILKNHDKYMIVIVSPN